MNVAIWLKDKLLLRNWNQNVLESLGVKISISIFFNLLVEIML